MVNKFRVVFADRAEDIQHNGRSVDGDCPMRDIRWNQKQRSCFNGSSFIADRQLDSTGNQNSSLFVRMVMQRNLGPVIHFQVGKHQILAKRSSHPASGDGGDRFKLAEVDESHGRSFRRCGDNW